MCRGSAFSYCKESRVPVCSKVCKLDHLSMMSSFDHRIYHMRFSEKYISDARDTLDMLS
jgi:brefeldin A-inhibited guanine nucleotide-exchange protein